MKYLSIHTVQINNLCLLCF